MSWHIARLAGLAFLSVFEVAGASPIVYVVNEHILTGDFTLSGSITLAEGRFGFIGAEDISHWSLVPSAAPWRGVSDADAGSGWRVGISCAPDPTSCAFYATPTSLEFIGTGGATVSFTTAAPDVNYPYPQFAVTFTSSTVRIDNSGPCGVHFLEICDVVGTASVTSPYQVGAAVPEPSLAPLFGIGLACLGFAWKRAHGRQSTVA